MSAESIFDIALVVVGGVVLVLGLFSRALRRISLSEPMLAMAVGILLGNPLFGPIRLGSLVRNQDLVEQGAHLTLAIGLMSAALRLPRDFLTTHGRALSVILGLGMPGMWLAAGLLVWAVTGLPFWVALLAGGVFAPTDPVLANSIFAGPFAEETIPSRLREVLTAESGANDGLGYLFIFLPLFILQSPDRWLGRWIGSAFLWQVVGGTIIGAIIGYAAGRALEWAEAHDTMGRPSFSAYVMALSLLALGGIKLAGSDGLLGVFAAGVAISFGLSPEERREEHYERVQETFNRFFMLPIFVLFGMLLPWKDWIGLGWKGLAAAAAVILLRRLPLFFALRRALPGRLSRVEDTAFIGWFGPIGIGGLYYASFLVRKGYPVVWAVGSLVVALSILVYGVTTTPFSRWYDRAAKVRERREGGDAPPPETARRVSRRRAGRRGQP